jgi:hypothetical protein
MSLQLVQGKLRDVMREGRALAQEFERGQAESPLAEHFSQIQREQHSWPCTIAVLSADANARHEGLAWLLGGDGSAASVLASSSASLTELYLSDTGFVLDERSGARSEFHDLEALLGALRAEVREPSEGSDGETTRVSMTGPNDLRGIRLLVPESLSTLAASPGLVTRLITESHVLVFAAPAHWSESEHGAGTLEALAQGIGLFAPVITGVDGEAPARGWWQRLLPGLLTMLPGVARLDRPRPDWLVHANSELRQGVQLSGSVRRLQAAMAALGERYDLESRQLSARRVREERAARADAPALGDPNARRLFDQAKARLQDDLAALAKSTQESSRRSMLPEGPIASALEKELAALAGTDLRQIPAAKSVRLEVDEDYVQHARRTIRKALKEELQKDLATLRDGLDSLRGELERQLEQATRKPVSLSTPAPSETEIWTRMTETFGTDFRYKGELPKRGFLQRLGEGRRAVFGVMMILSLVGSMVGFNWRRVAVVGILFLLLFIGAVVYTYRTWKHEDAERVAAELDRVRDYLGSELRKVIAEAQREKQAKLGELLESSKRMLGGRMEDAARDLQAHEQLTTQEERERARVRLRKLEQQQRELQVNGQKLVKLRQDSAALESELVRALGEGLRRAGQAA